MKKHNFLVLLGAAVFAKSSLLIILTHPYDIFSKLAEITIHCKITNDWTCYVEHKL